MGFRLGLFFAAIFVSVLADLQCDHRCATCYGSLASECYSCVRNAYKEGTTCHCLTGYTGVKCSKFKGKCIDKWEFCNGPDKQDCLACIGGAYMSNQGDCFCYDGYSGDKCDFDMRQAGAMSQFPSQPTSTTGTTGYQMPTGLPTFEPPMYVPGKSSDYGLPAFDSSMYPPGKPSDHMSSGHPAFESPAYAAGNLRREPKASSFRGMCHTLCQGGCTGPEASDCLNCVTNSHLSPMGYCVCNKNWYGDKCTQHYKGTVMYDECHPRCRGGCTGLDLQDCIECVENAHKDMYGYCVCDPYFNGQRCLPQHEMEYNGQCDLFCEGGCTGPKANECVNCVAHAHKDQRGFCICDDFYGGNDCSRYTGYKGKCDVRCSGNCSGPTNADCEVCVDHADFNVAGRCVCDENWTGPDCTEWDYVGECNPICIGCTGPNPADCLQCIHNSYWTVDGCKCEENWTGDNCKQEVYSDMCDAKCDGCYGPRANECKACIKNASLNNYGYCICDANWAGEYCQVYEKSCHPRCKICHGPYASDWDTCVAHSTQDNYGYCQCNHNWSGSDCSIYAGVCHIICDGCSGPEPNECDYCVEKAHKDDYDFCICDDFWSFEDCSKYIGTCSPLCNGCVGPAAYDCENCTEHAHQDENGWCICDYYWGGEYCHIWKGECDPKCSVCIGPYESNCLTCALNSTHDDRGYCKCDESWTGPDCSVFVGKCHPVCKKGCMGPGHESCVACGNNAHRNSSGYCVCNDQWKLDDCSLWSGECDPKWDGCTGPRDTDCLTCVAHASANLDGRCKCDEYYVQRDCSQYRGECDPTCNSCKGPSAHECYECMPNAMRNDEGLCTCKENWSGNYCRVYIGTCDPKWDMCHGPSASECDKCVRNSIRSATGDCVCETDWSGDNCSIFSGICDKRCKTGCTGPTNADCNECLDKAELVNGACVCRNEWNSKEDCSEWSGKCAQACAKCSGFYSMDCHECAEHAYRTPEGLCTCEQDWEDLGLCTMYIGVCSPLCKTGSCTGPSSFDCIECNTNTMRNSIGECVCKPYYGDASCSYYTGRCDHHCNGCTGPTPGDWVTCVENAHIKDGLCQCQNGWIGPRCSSYGNFCNKKCVGCSGPYASDCVKCVDNAIRDHSGQCVCINGWEGDDCTEEIIQCHTSCETCNGKRWNDCESCFDGNALMPDERGGSGICTPCDNNCATCFGTTDQECLTCNPGKTIVDLECKCCQSDCLECDSADGRGQCTSCHNDASLHGGDCKCKQGFRSPVTNEWESECPTGLRGVYCRKVEETKALKFIHDKPWSQSGLSAESCNPPNIKPGVAALFNGTSHHLRIQNLTLSTVFSIRLWVRVQNTNSSIMSLETNWLEADKIYESFNETCSAGNILQNPPLRPVIDLWTTGCNGVVLDFGLHEHLTTDENQLLPDKWAEVLIRVSSNFGTDPLYRQLFSIELELAINARHVKTGHVKGYTIWKDDDMKMFVGSYLGQIYQMKGFLHSFEYSPSLLQPAAQMWLDENFQPGTKFEQSFTCAANEFYMRECLPCDESCVFGCSNAKPCVQHCHESCLSCQGKKVDQCTECFCGAELQLKPGYDNVGRCVCSGDETGYASNCQPKCSEGCSNWDGLNSEDCVLCSPGYELANQDLASGECSECQLEKVYADGLPTCNLQGHRRPRNPCECEHNEWFDGQYCRLCPQNCAHCENEVSFETAICSKCEPGHVFLSDSDICLDQCPTGYFQGGDGCIGDDMKLFQCAFPLDFDPVSPHWKYKTSYIHDELIIELRPFPGWPASLPSIIDDRGAWFDGKEDVLQFSQIIYNHSFSVDMWLRPHSNGDIYVIKQSPEDSSSCLTFGLKNFFMIFEDHRFGNSVQTSSNLIEFQWTHVALTAKWEYVPHSTHIGLWHKNSLQESASFHHALVSFYDSPTQTTLGAYNDHSGIDNAYRGFIYSIRMFNYALVSFVDVISDECHGDVVCEICPSVPNICPGVCNWNHYWNGSRCQRCPVLCKGGCQRSGECQNAG